MTPDLRPKRAAFFNVGDPITFGKYQNKPGRIVRFLDDGKGNPLIEIEPVPKGLKKNKIMPLFRIRHRLAPKVAARYLDLLAVREAMTRLAADDMQAILLKLRKGVTSPIESVGKLTKVLDYLGGWEVKPFVGLVHVKFGGSYFGPPASVQAVHELALEHQVSSLPPNPQIDAFYVMDVQEPRSLHGDELHFSYKLWVGAAGYKVTSPKGKVFELLPDDNIWAKGRAWIDLRALPKYGKKSGLKHIRMYDCVKWLKAETEFDQQVLAALGMDAHEKPAPRTRDNTGSCPCCFRNIKLRAKGAGLPTMVDHGYERPGWGSNQGNCYGVGFPPFELSPEGTKHLVEVLKSKIENSEEALVRFKDPDLEFLYAGDERHMEKITPADPRWKSLLKRKIDETGRRIQSLTKEVGVYSRLVAEWKEEPLPQPGVPAKKWKLT